MLIATGLALVIHAPAFDLIVIPGIVVAYSAIIAAEEEYLRGKFGGQYASMPGGSIAGGRV